MRRPFCGIVLVTLILAANLQATSLFYVQVQPTAVRTGQPLRAEWQLPTTHAAKDWLGLFRVGQVPGKDAPLWRVEVGNESRGERALAAPSEAGAYYLRYFNAGGFVERPELRSSVIPVVSCSLGTPTSAIHHLVVLVQENHSFDSYFARYCQAPVGTAPACQTGPACCEAGPEKDPGTGKPWLPLTDAEHASVDPDHSRACELAEMNGGKMDHFLSASCGSPHTFAYAGEETVGPYWDLAHQYAMGDRVFQSVPGASSSNDMYLTQARFLFPDNTVAPKSIAGQCLGTEVHQYENATIVDALHACGAQLSWYMEGYADARKASPSCAGKWPTAYDPSDFPVAYYRNSADQPTVMKDFSDFSRDLKAGTLPPVSFVKPLGIRTEHPGHGIRISDGVKFVTGIIDEVERSPYAQDTLILVTPDEAGGYFDHVAPPPVSTVDGQPYGGRIYFLAVGRFAKRNHISHVQLEHSSILRFIEWNWLAGDTGHLDGRDATANNLGSLLDAAQTVRAVPE